MGKFHIGEDSILGFLTFGAVTQSSSPKFICLGFEYTSGSHQRRFCSHGTFGTVCKCWLSPLQMVLLASSERRPELLLNVLQNTECPPCTTKNYSVQNVHGLRNPHSRAVPIGSALGRRACCRALMSMQRARVRSPGTRVQASTNLSPHHLSSATGFHN